METTDRPKGLKQVVSSTSAPNICKSKKMVDIRRMQGSGLAPLQCVCILEDLSYNGQTEHVISKSRQQLYLLRYLRRFKVSTSILKIFFLLSLKEHSHWVHLDLVWQ